MTVIKRSDYPTVSKLVGQIKYSLERSFHRCIVQGEITNISKSGNGHFYFFLSDQDAGLSAVLFKGDAFRNPYMRSVKEGDKVLCQGEISVYPKRGSFQLVTKKITPLGDGDQKAVFERLKAKLSSEGLFDLDRKVKVPRVPRKIAVVTARQGAALQDFIKVFSRRASFGNLLLVPAVVQGDKAPLSVINCLNKIQKYNESVEKSEKIDLIIITRGGGQSEDLACFNDEGLIRRISELNIPLISAIGHEVDFTLCDYISDVRAETPTAAAEMITQYQAEINHRLKALESRIKTQMTSVLVPHQRVIDRARPSALAARLQEALKLSQRRLEEVNPQKAKSAMRKVHIAQMDLDRFYQALGKDFPKAIEKSISQTEHFHQQLQILGPKSVLERGYAIIQHKNKAITSSKNWPKEKEPQLKAIFHDGTVSI